MWCVCPVSFGKDTRRHIRQTVQIMLRLSDQNRAIRYWSFRHKCRTKTAPNLSWDWHWREVKDEPCSGRPKVRWLFETIDWSTSRVLRQITFTGNNKAFHTMNCTILNAWLNYLMLMWNFNTFIFANFDIRVFAFKRWYGKSFYEAQMILLFRQHLTTVTTIGVISARCHHQKIFYPKVLMVYLGGWNMAGEMSVKIMNI